MPSWPERLPIHPFAELFPALAGSKLRELADDIAANGLRETIKIIRVDGVDQLLDGRNRLSAMELAGFEIFRQGKLNPTIYEPVTPDDPLAYVVSLNLVRRHLSDSQRGLIAARIANHRPGGRTRDQVTMKDAAGLLNVPLATVQQARRVVPNGSDDQVAAVESGAVKVGRAAVEIAQRRSREMAGERRKPQPGQGAPKTPSELREREAAEVAAVAEASDPDAIADFLLKLDKLIAQVAAQKVVPLVSIAARVDAVRRFADALRVSQAQAYQPRQVA
jgi:hypothetical protein